MHIDRFAPAALLAATVFAAVMIQQAHAETAGSSDAEIAL